MSNRLVNNAGAKKRAQEIGSAVKGNTISNSRNALDLARSLGGSANGGMASAATGAVKGTTGSMRGAATGAVSGVSSSVTKDPSDVIGTLTGNATVDASPKGGVAASAKGTNFQTAMDQLRNYYRQQIENAKAGISNTVSRAQEGYSGLKSSMEQLREYYRKQAAKEKSDLAYADYLTGGKVSQDIKYGNYLTNGRYSGYNSYADYLASIGQTPQDSQKTRDASVARANADYARALAGYGQTGEQLARSGLSNTGYSDASNNAAYAAKQNAILQADATKAATDQSNRLGYAQYLQAYDAQQQNKMLTVLEYTTQAGMTEEQAKAYAKAVGFDDTIAESIGKAQAAYTESTSGTATKATDLYNTLVSNENFAYDPATKNSLRQQLLNSGYDEATVDDVLGRLDKTYTTAQGDSYELFKKALTDGVTEAKIGSTIEGWDNMSDSEKASAFTKKVISSDITEDQKLDILKTNLNNMAEGNYSEVLNILANYQELGMPTNMYNKLLTDISDDILGNVSYEYKSGNGHILTVDIGGKKTQVKMVLGTNILKSYPKTTTEKGTLSASGRTGNEGKTLVISRGGEWQPVKRLMSFSSDGLTEEQLTQLYNMLYQKYNNPVTLRSRKARMK